MKLVAFVRYIHWLSSDHGWKCPFDMWYDWMSLDHSEYLSFIQYMYLHPHMLYKDDRTYMTKLLTDQ